MSAATSLGQISAEHLCLCFVGSQIDERFEYLIAKLEAEGRDFCLLVFPEVDFAQKQLIRQAVARKNSIAIRSRVKLRAHWQDGPKTVVLQSPYSEHYPNYFWAEKLANRQLSFHFVGYGLRMSNWKQGHLRNPSYDYADAIYLNSYVDFARMKLRHPRKARLSADLIVSELLSSRHAPQENGNSRWLWSPHWSQSWPNAKKGYSRFKESVVPIYDFLRSNPNTVLTFSPHPILADALESLLQSQTSQNREVRAVAAVLGEDVGNYKKLLSLPNFQLSNSSLTEEILSHQLLITDGVSIIFYWALTGKPMIVFRDSASPHFGAFGSLCAAFFTTVKSGNDLNKGLQAMTRIGVPSLKSKLLRLILQAGLVTAQ